MSCFDSNNVAALAIALANGYRGKRGEFMELPELYERKAMGRKIGRNLFEIVSGGMIYTAILTPQIVIFGRELRPASCSYDIRKPI